MESEKIFSAYGVNNGVERKLGGNAVSIELLVNDFDSDPANIPEFTSIEDLLDMYYEETKMEIIRIKDNNGNVIHEKKYKE